MPRVSSGDPLRIQAATWNKLQSLVGVNAGQILAGSSGRGLVRGTYLPIKNSSGSTVDRFNVLGISGVVVSPTDNLADFKNNVALTGTTTSSTYLGKFAVMQETVANGKIGLGLVSGVTVAQIDVGHADHDRVDVDTSGDTKLDSQFYGAGRILYKESSTGTKWAVIDVGAFVSPPLKATASGNISVDSSGTVQIQRNGSGSESVTAYLNWMEGTTAVSSGDELIIQFFPDENKYVITGAEC